MIDLPPLEGLRVFEAAARLTSFNQAAEVLNITPSAVSHRIRGLEEALGVALFRRKGRGVTLTPEGEAYLPAVQDALAALRAATRRISTPDRSGPLTMSLAPSFAIRWLLPRLSRFQKAHPDIDIQFASSIELADFRSGEVDLGVRFGRGEWPDLVAERLLAEDAVPVCSPDLLKMGGPLKNPDDLAGYQLLHAEQRPDDWRMWLLAAGATKVDPSRGLVFQNLPVTIEAASSGLGFAIADRHIVEYDIEQGRLVMPFDIHMPSKSAFYLVYPEENADNPGLKAFRAWLFTELADVLLDPDTAPLGSGQIT